MAAVQLYIDGPLLSSLFYDNACGGSDQEGFLFGQMKHEIEDSVNDAQINNRSEKVIMVMQSIITSDSPCSFYENSGMIIEDKLQALVGQRGGKVIGWFRSRKNSSLEPSYLEKIIHQNLRSLTEEDDSFLFLIFTTQNNTFVSTHTFDHICLRSTDRFSMTFESVPIFITNLGNSAQGDYKRSTIGAVSNKILENIVKPKTEPLIHGIRYSIEKKLQSLCMEVSDSENSCSQLEEEVELLRAQYFGRHGSSGSAESVIPSNTNKRNSRLEFGLVKGASSVGSNSTLNAFANPFTSKNNSDHRSKGGSPTF